MARESLRRGAVYLSAAVLLGALALPPLSAAAPAAPGGNIVQEWYKVKPPPPVKLKTVKVNPADTAFLILDIIKPSCNEKRRPRCVASAPKIGAFLKRVREKRMLVVYSTYPPNTAAAILPEVAPKGDEPLVTASVDKFFHTDLEKILKDRHIKTVIIAGTTAEGAVIHTATQAALRGYKVIVPVDGMSAGTLYAEQYTAWHLVNAPGSKKETTLTTFDRIEF